MILSMPEEAVDIGGATIRFRASAGKVTWLA